MSAPKPGVITVRYSGGTYLARHRDTGKTCSCTESPKGAVRGLAKKLHPAATDSDLSEISFGVWLFHAPTTAPERSVA
ncbi:MAG: hypothetical protein U1G08_02480 [Verrucomicrobiota bacterium]